MTPAASTELLSKELTDMANKVEQFQNNIQGLPIPKRVQPLADHRMRFRTGHLREEIDEFVAAYERGDLKQQTDGLGDLVYVAIGALLEMGVPYHMIFAEIHSKNMEKVRGETKRAESGGFDAIKPEGWTPPNFDAILEEMDVRWHVSNQLVEVTRLSMAKSEDYNSETNRDDYFPFGDISYSQMIWTKGLRAMNIVKRAMKGKGQNFEGIRDTLRDIINYATYWLEWLEHNTGLWNDRRQGDRRES